MLTREYRRKALEYYDALRKLKKFCTSNSDESRLMLWKDSEKKDPTDELRRMMPELLKLRGKLREIKNDDPTPSILELFTLLADHNSERQVKKLDEISEKIKESQPRLSSIVEALSTYFSATRSPDSENNKTKAGQNVTIDSIYIEFYGCMHSLSYCILLSKSPKDKQIMNGEIYAVINRFRPKIARLIDEVENHLKTF